MNIPGSQSSIGTSIEPNSFHSVKPFARPRRRNETKSLAKWRVMSCQRAASVMPRRTHISIGYASLELATSDLRAGEAGWRTHRRKAKINDSHFVSTAQAVARNLRVP